MMKKSIPILALFAAILMLVASCTAYSNGENQEGNSHINDTIIEHYVYLPEFLNMAHVTELLHGAILHEGRIYYYYVRGTNADSEPTIVVASMLTDGTMVSQTEIPGIGTFLDISALHITEEENLALILTSTEWTEQGSDTVVLYLEYSIQGVEIINRELPGLVPQDNNLFYIKQALFTENGNLALLASTDNGSIVYLLDEQFSLRGQMEVGLASAISQTQDGRVIVAVTDSDVSESTSLRKIDFAIGDWGEIYPVSMVNIRDMHPAQDGDSFDLYIDDGIYLFGYNIAAGERIPLLNWTETGVGLGAAPHLNFLDDGRFSLLVNGNFRTDAGNPHTEHIILTRTARNDLPERATITLGGFSIPRDILEQVATFNRTNQTHQIQVKDYIIYSTDEDFFAGEFRFLADVISGQTPDILMGQLVGFNTLTERGMLVDLYPLIDADPILERSDFLPNILLAMESSDGSLPMLSNSFTLQTIIGMADAVGDVQSWTFADMAELLERTTDERIAFILGEWMTAETLLNMALTYSDFINRAESSVDLNNDEFIHLLELSTRLPNAWTVPTGEPISSVTRMQRGEQLLDLVSIENIFTYQMYAAKLGDDIVSLGMPTQAGGVHVIHMSGFAISTTSTHQDAAWGFIRQFLMPDIDDMSIELTIPLRIDLYEEMLAAARTPRFIIDADGNKVEERIAMGMGDFIVTIYPLTEIEEMGFRAIAEGSCILRRLDETLMEMVREETLPFFAGNRSASDTARILQNRIQTYLSERV